MKKIKSGNFIDIYFGEIFRLIKVVYAVPGGLTNSTMSSTHPYGITWEPVKPLRLFTKNTCEK
ncbi:MAG: hypothetical protein OXE77_11585 [Flavobacteriaceae bacterium]|nr:hypothetical protein [Flavobacteriaceae bacterium]MCY4266489.1 hypothetical protein [Flavobacteriaceae bacterium]